jgi:hypothetical protein
MMGGLGGAGGRGDFAGMGGFGGGRFGGAGGFGELAAIIRGGMGTDTDSMLAHLLVNPIANVLALRDSIGLSKQQTDQVRTIADTLQSRLDQRRDVLSRALERMDPGTLSDVRGQGAAPLFIQDMQSEIQPQLDGVRRDSEEALSMLRRMLTQEQWQKLPDSVRNAERPARGFNAIGMIDRMLANPITVLLALKDTLGLSGEQIARIEEVSRRLQETLDLRRAELGKRFDNVQGREQGRVFQQLQPDIEASRREIRDALEDVKQILTPDQWSRIPEQIRNPFQTLPHRPG